MNRGLALSLSVILLVAMTGSSLDLARAQPAGPEAPEAPLGAGFTYQGRLMDGSQPANGSYDLRFQLFTESSGGSPVGSVDKGDVPVSAGYFTVLLDFGPAFDGRALWLEVSVRPGSSTGAYTPLSPRQPFTAAPYAAYSLKAPWSGLVGEPRNDHNHLGQTWTGSNNSLMIEGSFDTIANPAPMVLGNSGGNGLQINSASGNGASVLQAGAAGLAVGMANGDGVNVWLTGSQNNFKASTENNGFEVQGAEGNGLYVGRAGGSGVWVDSADGSGVRVGSAGANGVSVGSAVTGLNVNSTSSNGVLVSSAGNHGVYVSSAGNSGFRVEKAGEYGVRVVSTNYAGVFVSEAGGDGVFAQTTDPTLHYGFYTPNRIYAGSGVSSTFYSLIAQVMGSASLSPGDLVSAAGLGQPLPDNSEPVPLVLLADGDSSGLVGVVDTRLALTPQPQPEDETGEPALELLMAEGPAAPGDYVAIRVLGIAQVKVDVSSGEIQPGMRLTAASLPGMARVLLTTEVNGIQVAESAPTIGVALSAPDEDGLVWVLINPQ